LALRGALRASGTAGVVAFALLVAAPAAYAVPPNDNWANREVIATLPFTDTETDVATATVAATDPLIPCRVGAAGQGGNTLWYSYTTGPATEYVTISTATSDYDTEVAVYEGTPGSFRLIHGGCNEDAGDATSFQSRVTGVRLNANTTYSIEVSQLLQDDVPATLHLNVAAAATYQVTKTADTADGACDADCSLREAVLAANATPGAVLVPAGTYTLIGPITDRGDLDVASGMAIYGAGAAETVIDADDVDRVIRVDPGNTSRVSLTLAGVTLLDGRVGGEGGGGLLALGIGNYLDVDSVVVESAVTTGNGGGIRLVGRGRLVRTVLHGNEGLAGGGINLPGGSLVIVEVRDSTIESNTSTSPGAAGGGGLHAVGRTEVVNTTVHGNRARFSGGGLHFLGTNGSPALRSVTVSGNTADSDANGMGTGGGVRFEGTGAISVRNSVLADNTNAAAQDCSKGVNGTLTSAFNHLETAAGGCAFTGTGDVTGSDPGLGALAANGGPTSTLAVFPGSPLVDAGDPDGCTDRQGVVLAFDQRGFPRNRGARCDKGAFESDPAVVCASAPVSTAEDTPLTVTLACTDPEGQAVTYGVASAQRATVTGAGAARTYAPVRDYNGPDTILFSASDGVNPPVFASLGVTVTPVNDAPVAAADTGSAGMVAAPGVLANDTDADRDPLTAQLVTAPANGTVTLNADGGYVYTPAPGFSGTDTFTYVARDAVSASAPATVTITVAAPAPSFVPPPTVQPAAAPEVSGVRAARSGRALRLTLSQPAQVRIRLLQERRGVRRGRRCVAPTRPGRRCVRYVLVRSFTRRLPAGANTLTLPRVRRARYVVEVRATGSGGLRSSTLSGRLRLGQVQAR
jgi:CSLREA domain-containing protein